MIQKLNKGTSAKFGNGTVRIRPYTLKTKFGGVVELTHIRKVKDLSKVTVNDVIPESNKIMLSFDSVESLDTLISHLQDLRQDMENEST